MTTFISVPAGLGYESLNWTLMRNKVRAQSWLGKTSQEQARPGDYWKASVTFSKETGRDGLLLTKFLEEASVAGARIIIDAPQMRLGAWSTPEMLVNYILDTTANWAGLGSGGVFSVNARRFLITSGGSSYGPYSDSPTTGGVPHAALGDAIPGLGSTQWRLELREQPSNVLLETVDATAGGRIIAATTLSAGATHTRAAYRNRSTGAGSKVLWGNPSVGRCLLVNGASQVGNRLNVSGGPANVSAAMLAGEFVTVEMGIGTSQLLRLVDDFDADGSGLGELRFEPTLRASPASGAAVIVHKPYSDRMILTQGHAPVDIRAPMTYSTTVEFEEDLSA